MNFSLLATATCKLEAVAVLHVKEIGGHFVFGAKINGNNAYLLLDTGAFKTSLSVASAPRLGVILNRRDFETFGVGGSESAYQGFVRRMRVGGISLDGLDVNGSDVLNDTGVDGMFGMDGMSAYDIDLDIAGHAAILYEASGGCGTPAVSISQPVTKVPLVLSRASRQAEIDISVENRPVRALIDSGSPTTFMFRRAASRLGANLSGFQSRHEHLTRGIGRFPVRAVDQVFSNAKIGGLVFNNVGVEVIDQRDLA